MAETGGFEPPVGFDPHGTLAMSWIKPLSQVSSRADFEAGRRLERWL